MFLIKMEGVNNKFFENSKNEEIFSNSELNPQNEELKSEQEYFFLSSDLLEDINQGPSIKEEEKSKLEDSKAYKPSDALFSYAFPEIQKAPLEKKITLVDLIIDELKKENGHTRIENYLKYLDADERNDLLEKTLPYMSYMMCSMNGNYFFQKLVPLITVEQRLRLIHQIKDSFLPICKDKYGTHSIQSLIRIVNYQNETQILFDLIHQNLFQLITDTNAHHIVIEMLLKFPEEERQFVNDFIITNLDKIAVNMEGSQCVKKFIAISKNTFVRDVFLQSLQNKFFILANNRFSYNILILAMKVFGVQACYFMLKEVKDNLLVLVNSQGFCIEFLEKFFIFLSKTERLIFHDYALRIVNNQKLFMTLISSPNGIRLIKVIFHYSPMPMQKAYIQNISLFKVSDLIINDKH